ncbi:hypothetical protein [Candidatus Protochlamydia phocaeensis]|uniref:hypothetical protein n=1 Tax=Candidatus Protochlamydia phocaeensis TaxID=1414722 RepID=UPI0008389475|nr:hypothetical protein [Candidatus Protochlamydia phocaeensis]
MNIICDFSRDTKFQCSHDILVENWNQDGYDLTVTEGECGICAQREVKVLTQLGAERFGVKVGFCPLCVAVCLPETPCFEASVGFSDSEDKHVIRMDSEKVEAFLKDPIRSGCLSEEEINGLIEGVAKHKNNPSLAQAREYKKKAYQCKDCFGYILEMVKGENYTFSDLSNSRKHGFYTVACFGCLSLVQRINNCSMVICPDPLCQTQCCTFCLNGASIEKELQHDIKLCSERISNQEVPPEPRLCDCPDQKEQI